MDSHLKYLPESWTGSPPGPEGAGPAAPAVSDIYPPAPFMHCLMSSVVFLQNFDLLKKIYIYVDFGYSDDKNIFLIYVLSLSTAPQTLGIS